MMRGGRLRAAILDRLRSNYHATMASVAASYGIAPISMDLSPTSKQVFQGYLTADQIDESAPSRYPMLVIYTSSSSNEHTVVPSSFSGRVSVVLDWYVSFRGGNAQRDSETIADALEDTVYKIFDDGSWPQLHGAPDAVMPGIDCARQPIEMAGEHWRQMLRFTMTFEVLQ
jgi:hypothetical protein